MAKQTPQEVCRRYRAATNMSAAQLRKWSKDPCSRTASLSREPIKRNLRLLEKPCSEWTEADARGGRKTIAFIARHGAQRRSSGGGRPRREGCPGGRDVGLKNWAYDPGRKNPSPAALYCFDYDGTLSLHDGDPAVRAVATRALRAGACAVLVTARPGGDRQAVLADLARAGLRFDEHYFDCTSPGAKAQAIAQASRRFGARPRVFDDDPAALDAVARTVPGAVLVIAGLEGARGR